GQGASCGRLAWRGSSRRLIDQIAYRMTPAPTNTAATTIIRSFISGSQGSMTMAKTGPKANATSISMTQRFRSLPLGFLITELYPDAKEGRERKEDFGPAAD